MWNSSLSSWLQGLSPFWLIVGGVLLALGLWVGCHVLVKAMRWLS